jgi:hypothetical protein
MEHARDLKGHNSKKMKLLITSQSSALKKFTASLRRFGSDPWYDWKIIVVAGIVLGLIVLCSSAYLFYEIHQGDLFVVKPEERKAGEKFDREKLVATIKLFEQKKLTLEALQRQKEYYSDPAQF